MYKIEGEANFGGQKLKIRPDFILLPYLKELFGSFQIIISLKLGDQV